MSSPPACPVGQCHRGVTASLGKCQVRLDSAVVSDGVPKGARSPHLRLLEAGAREAKALARRQVHFSPPGEVGRSKRVVGVSGSTYNAMVAGRCAGPASAAASST